ncbi:receptor protein kinase protein [Salix suchowensis]|nr:receptor protein kinase protein [Salix suchowensis]
MSPSCINYLHFLGFFLLGIVLPTFALNTDGVLLLSFKYSILRDPLSVLETWNYEDKTPCLWKGVTCTELGLPGTPDMLRVTSLVLPDSQLLGSIPPDVGYIEHLRHLDLSNNFLNGSLPNSFDNATELQVISLSNNEISGELPGSIGALKSLQLLNLSDNALAGKVPGYLTALQNLTVLSLRTNYFSGYVPSGFNYVEVLDLSSNLLNGSLPLNFGGDNLHYLNLSYNKLTGPISLAFAKRIPVKASIDLSFNNLSGAIPENLDLCGKPLSNLCSIPSTISTPPNISTTSPAIAVIPKPLESSSPQLNSTGNSPSSTRNQAKSGLKPATIVAIAVSDLAGIAILALVILYVYQIRKRKTLTSQTNQPNKERKLALPSKAVAVREEIETRKPINWPCLTLKGEETSGATTSDDDQGNEDTNNTDVGENNQEKDRKLVVVDGETELELETLLKASAYTLGTSGGSIVYKAVLGDGTAFAVRRIGESGVERLRDFENQVRLIAKLKHPNLVRVCGFYWGGDEKLVVYDYVSNGSLASAGYRKPGSSPGHLPLEVRFKIAKGVARGLAFIHGKKHVHGNIKPNNILLNLDMEPIISDFGLDRLVFGNNSSKASSSSRHFSSQRFASSTQEHSINAGLFSPSTSSAAGSSPYQAPESLNNPKPNPKWDVYSFGVVLLELLTGRVFSDGDLSQWTAGSIMEDKNRVLRLADVAIQTDVEVKEDAILACLKLGFSCAAFVPQKRPSMKEALQILEKIPSVL